MRSLSKFASLIQNLFHREHRDRELDDEVAAYVRMLVDEKIAAGVSPEEAHRLAQLELGGAEQVKEEVRAVRAGAFIETIGADLRYACRVLAKKPGFTIVALLTLAIGIGANISIFSVVNAVLLQPLPYANPNRLVIVWSVLSSGGSARTPAAGPEFEELKARCRLFKDFAGIWAGNGALTGDGEPEEVRLGFVTANFFSVLGVNPELGRSFLPEEAESRGAARSILLSYGLWQRRYGSNPNILGQTVHLDGQPFTVIGVMPRSFSLVFPPDASVPDDLQAWVLFPYKLAATPRDNQFLRVLGRLQNGASLTEAQSELDSVATQLRSQFQEYGKQGLRITAAPLLADTVADARPALLALFVAVGLVLLIACANVANLLLARANERRKEIGVRVALGATRSRLMRQLLTESLLLACVGGAVGLGIASGLLRWPPLMWSSAIPRMASVTINSASLVFTLALSLLTGVIFGMAPAWGTSRTALLPGLQEGGRTMGSGRETMRHLLIFAEVMLGMVLLIGTGLMVRTFSRLLRVDLGFEPDHVLTFQTVLPRIRYRSDQDRASFVHQLTQKLQAISGVTAVAETSHLPFDDFPNWYSYYWPEGAAPTQKNATMADYRSISPDYFPGLRVDLISGRNFNDLDGISNHRVVIVDDSLAARTWPGADPIGKKLHVEHFSNFAFPQDWAEVVGIVRHIRIESLTEPERGQVYLPYSQSPRPWVAFVVKVEGRPEDFAGVVRQEVSSLDKDLPITKLRSMDSYVAMARSKTRFVTSLAGTLALVALALACIGIFGVTSYSVAQKRGEIGIRMALGAQRSDILYLMLKQTLLVVIQGIVAGVICAALLSPLLKRLLFGVPPLDSATFAAVAIGLFIVAFLACYLPAHRASGVHPMLALRHEQ